MDTLDVKAREFTAGKDWSVSLIVELHKFLLQQDFKDEHQVILTILRVIHDAELAEAKLLEESKEKELPKLPWNEYKKIVLEVCPAIHSAFLDPMKQLNTFLGEIEDVFEVPRPFSPSAAAHTHAPVPSCWGRLYSLVFPLQVKNLTVSATPVVPVDNTRGGLEIRSALPTLPGSVDVPPPSLLSRNPASDLSGSSL